MVVSLLILRGYSQGFLLNSIELRYTVYAFPYEPIHVNIIYHQPNGRSTYEQWSKPMIPIYLCRIFFPYTSIYNPTTLQVGSKDHCTYLAFAGSILLFLNKPIKLHVTDQIVMIFHHVQLPNVCPGRHGWHPRTLPGAFLLNRFVLGRVSKQGPDNLSTLSPTIMEVENTYIRKVTTIGRTHF